LPQGIAAAVQVERPVIEARLPRARVDLETVALDRLVEQVRAVPESMLGEPRLLLQRQLVIACADQDAFAGQWPMNIYP
jgi:hypothetical protein